MNFELDLEESSYMQTEESIKDCLIRLIVDKTYHTMSGVIVSKVNAKLDKLVVDKVEQVLNDKIEAVLDDFMSKPITVSDGYKQVEYTSILDMVQARFTSSYQLELGTNCSNSNVLLTRIKNEVGNAVSRQTSSIGKLLRAEGAKLAREALEDTNLAKYIRHIQ